MERIAVVGLGVMGQNLALNLAGKGFPVAGFDLAEAQRKRMRERIEGRPVVVYDSWRALAAALERPRKLLLMVPAGRAVDDVLQQLQDFLEPGDVVVDGGNSHFQDTERRVREAAERGWLFVGTGISGGEQGALLGPAVMPGGNPEAWPLIRPMLEAIAAKAPDGEPCCKWMGKGGAGHFVKMVHNGIEYGDMQMICEAYWFLRTAVGLSPAKLAEVFAAWNQGELNSYLIEITSDILRRTDPETGRPIVDVVLDTAGQKGTGKWTSQTALDLGAPAPTIAEAVFARFLSALKEERVTASKILPPASKKPQCEEEDWVEPVRQALYTSKICSYAQGFQLLSYASREYDFNLDLAAVASIWRAGCIIRAQFLDKIREAFDGDPGLTNLLLAPYFREAVGSGLDAWRRVVAEGALRGVPLPALSSALAYYDAYRSEVLPANLLQAQRDYFGAHRFERIDRPRGEFFHVEWQSL
ncbi:MAG TPA: NADP-dependent phosphogluconate dehydrogenase [Acidobacteriota bacterium]|nr:NADP-dependent phosphogluconate dehydrogenase [Acidobacteriota bacterium]HRR56801.1 NADP-dependent phosphogluconate dehydrogenase [Acidobacteriota bacterium]